MLEGGTQLPDLKKCNVIHRPTGFNLKWTSCTWNNVKHVFTCKWL